MITFLRKIRKQLLSENKATTYLLYAIGEIFLVVVGILIALSIDNWNDQRKDRNKELTYLKDIKSDLGLNLKEIEIFIEEKKTAVESANIIIAYCENDTVSNASYFNLHNLNVQIFNRFEEKHNTFNELENSGQLSMITKKDIKNLLQDMDLTYRRIRFWEEHTYTDMRELIYSIYFQEADLNSTTNNYAYQLSNGLQGEESPLSLEEIRLLIKDKGFKNGFVLCNFNNQTIITNLELIKRQSEQLIELINEELNI